MRKRGRRTPKLFNPLVATTTVAVAFVGHRFLDPYANTADRKSVAAFVVILMVGICRVKLGWA